MKKKYLAYYENEWPANIAELTALENKPFVGYLKDQGVQFTVVPAPVKVPADNEIWYTTVDNTVLNPQISVDDTFGANIVSNTYENGKGVIVFDNNVTGIPMHSFQSNNLASIYLPNSLTSISTQAFRGSEIVSITIPRNVTQIGGHAFVECFALETIKYNGTKSEWNDIMANNYYSPFGAIGYRVPANVVHCIDGDVDLIFDESMPF